MGFIMKSVTSPTVTNGSFNVYFGEFAQVTNALVTLEQSMNISGDASAQIDISWNYITENGSTNYVTVYAMFNGHVPGAAADGLRRNATTAILNGKKCVILASGQ